MKNIFIFLLLLTGFTGFSQGYITPRPGVAGNIPQSKVAGLPDSIALLRSLIGTGGGGGSSPEETFTTLSGTSWDLSLTRKRKKTLSANTAITLTGAVSGTTSAILYVTQDATGSRTLTINGTAVTIDATALAGTLIGIVEVGGAFAFDTNVGGGAGGPAPPSLVDITFPTATNINGVGVLVNTSGVWTANGTSAVFGKTGLSNLKLPTGTDGYIMAQGTTGANNALFGFTTTNVQPTGYADLLYGFSISGTDIYKVDNGSLSGTPLGPITAGDFVRLHRVSGVVTLEISSDGITWGSPINTYSITNNGNLYIGVDIYGNNQGKMFLPKGYGIN